MDTNSTEIKFETTCIYMKHCTYQNNKTVKVK